MKQMKVWVLALICLAMLCSAASAAMLFIDPVETELGMGESVELAVVVEDVQHLGSYDIDVTWDPVLVTLSEVQPGPQITTVENIQSGMVQIAGLCNNETLDGISGTADLCYLTFTALKDNGDTSPIEIEVNNYGFLNSTTGAEIAVESITNGNITVLTSSVVDARIALANRQVPADKETIIRASVANQRDYETAPLDINVTIWNGDTVVNTTVYTAEVIQPGATFSREIPWTPGADGTFAVKIDVTSDDPLRGRTTDQKYVTAIVYQLYYTDDVIHGPDRTQVGNWFYEWVRVTTNKAGSVDVHFDVPDSFEIWGGANQTAYLYSGSWNYLYIWLRTDDPGRYTADQFTYNISAHGKGDSVHGKDVLVYAPSIEVNSVNTTRIAGDGSSETMKFNTLHTNNTHQNETVLVAQSGAQGRTLSGLEYLIGYPYGCVEQTTCKMLASMNVKNYYLGREDRPANFDSIRDRANASVSSGVDRLVRGGIRGQNSDGGWSLWGGDPSESSSSSYASYTFAKINQTDEDLHRLLVDKISYGDHVDDGTVNFEKLIEWFHDNPDDSSSGAWYWSAPVCHSWTKESNTAFVMLIHDMINQSTDLQPQYRAYMEENMQNATRYLIDNQEPNGAFSDDDDAEMATALGLWGLEVFGLPSDTVTEAEITAAKESAKAYLIGSQNADGSWYAAPYYGWYAGGRVTESTAYAILALNATGMENDNATIVNGVGWLVETYENRGSWGYTWASQAAIDALIVCQGTEVATGSLVVYIDGEEVHTFTMDDTHPREEYTLTDDQMETLMAGGTLDRDIFGDGYSTVWKHEVEGVLTGDGPIVLSVENTQWAPLNEIDNRIRNTHTIQMDGVEDGVFIPQYNTDIGVLADAEYDVDGFTISFDSSPSPMIVDTEAEVTIGATSSQDLFSPMIEVPIADFTFDNTSTITDGNDDTVSYEILNSTANIGQESIFIQPESWVQDEAYSYTFEIVPENYGSLNMSMRVIPLYDDSNVAVTSHTFEVTGTGNVTIHVQDEDYAPVTADSITVDGVTIASASTGEFTGLMEDTYAFSVNMTGFPDVHGNVTVSYGETAVYNVTMPTTMTEPVLILAEGGSGSIAGVAQIPGELNADNPEETAYNVSVMGDGGELGVALQFPMRYLYNNPVVMLNGVVLGSDEYELTPGTFTYEADGSYTTTNATLVVYNATSGTNYIAMSFEGDVWGDADNSGDVDIYDALEVLDFYLKNVDSFETYDYPDIFERDLHEIDIWDALAILDFYLGNVNEYYE